MSRQIPDVEAVLVAFANGAGYVAGVDRPSPCPPVFVRVRANGGAGRVNAAQAALTALVEVFAESEDVAASTAYALEADLAALAGVEVAGAWVYEVATTAPVDYPDEDAGLARFQFIATPRVALTPKE